MKKTPVTRLLVLMLCLCMVMGMAATAMAADVAAATIDHTRTGSLTIYKYDLTHAEKDGVWDGSYVSTGTYDKENVNDVLNPTNPTIENTLGNGQNANGYAIKGVEFSYLKVADIVQYSDNGEVVVLYGTDDDVFAGALGLETADCFPSYGYTHENLPEFEFYFKSETLINALAKALEEDPVGTKNTLETLMAEDGFTGTSVAMNPTDENGMTTVTGLELGLYLVVETGVPEMVTTTTNPFLVSVPMTTVNGGVNGSSVTNGGEAWNYDVTVYPKNKTGLPSLEKTLRESAADTGSNTGSTTDITDGYAHTSTASAGDVIEYQILSNLPGITSKATYLSQYGFVDTLSAGLTYNKSDVVLEFFSNEACTASVAKWTEADATPKFTVAYTANDDGSTTMSISMTEAGLKEINEANTVYTAANAVESGYSDCMMRVTYAATMESGADLVLGEGGSDNSVVLTWGRTSENYFDTLVDDAHIYSFGIDLTKYFEGNGDFSKVEFIAKNATDNYFVKATLGADGEYYVTDHVAAEADATHFVPVANTSSANPFGAVIIHGLEDDTYILTEVKTDNGFTLLDDDIEVVITAAESATACDIYASDVLGLLQNDPRYANLTADDLANLPQKELKHFLLAASATIDGNAVTMKADGTSANAYAPLSVTNTPGFDLPQSGAIAAVVIPMVGIAIFVVSILLGVSKKRRVADA